MGEFELIADLFAPLASHKGALGLTDDAAVLNIPEGLEAVITKDVMVAGVHFFEDADPALVAQKLLRVNLSDLAAMGAEPVGYWLGCQVPPKDARLWLTPFVEGLRVDQDAFGLSLMGGDTVATPGPIALSLTALGTVPRGQAVTRSGAKSGDRLFVSGTIGDGRLGLMVAGGEVGPLSEEDQAYLRGRLERPEPRLGLGKAVRGLATSMIDISDGLVADAGHMADASAVKLLIDADKVPLSRPARAALSDDQVVLADLLTGGDDYELLFTAPSSAADQVLAFADGCPVSEIGLVSEGTPGVAVLKDGAEMAFDAAGFTHF